MTAIDWSRLERLEERALKLVHRWPWSKARSELFRDVLYAVRLIRRLTNLNRYQPRRGREADRE